jgi:hypothetical protein
MEKSDTSALPPADSGNQTVGPQDASTSPAGDQPVKRGRGRPPKAPGAPKAKYTKGGSGKYGRKKARDRQRAGDAGMVSEADRALAAGAHARRERSKAAGDAPRAPRALPDWYTELLQEKEPGQSEQKSVTQLRHVALGILERGALPWAAGVLADPQAKDTDKARAADFVAKLSAGYITPDLAGAEDVPDLPPPIFQLMEGELPGGHGVTEALSAENAEDDSAGPQLAVAGGGGGGPSFTPAGAA